MSTFTKAVNNAKPVIKEGAKKAWDSEVGKDIRKEVRDAAVEIGSDLAIDAIGIGAEAVERKVRKKFGDRAGKSIEEAFDRSLETRLKKAKSAPLTERERNEQLLKAIGKEYDKTSDVVRVGQGVAKAAGLTSDAAKVTAASATGATTPVAGKIVTVAGATEVVADAVELGATIVTENSQSKAKDILEEASRIAAVPPKEDILIHFSANREKYIKACYLSDKAFGAEPLNKKLKNYLVDNFSKISNKTIGELLYLYFGYLAMSVIDRQWVRAAFGYLVSSATMVPHAVPNIGFVDDRIVISYVFDRVKDAINPISIKKGNDLRDELKSFAKTSGGTQEYNGAKKEVGDIDTKEATTTVVETDEPVSLGGVRTIRKF